MSKASVLRHLNKTGFTKKLNVWVPYESMPKNLMDRISICEALLKRYQIEPFLDRLIMGDEKWITYDNIVRKRSWSRREEGAAMVAKSTFTQNRVMLCIWWDCKGIVNNELLPPGETVSSDLYCQQLIRLQQAIEEKRPELANRKGVIFHQDNTPPHKSLTFRHIRFDKHHLKFENKLYRFKPKKAADIWILLILLLFIIRNIRNDNNDTS